MSYITLTPAYGRDYKTAKLAKLDFNANKDFIINDIFNRYDGKPINKSQCIEAGYNVILRFNKLTKTTAI